MSLKPSPAQVIQANIDVHTAVSAKYNEQPHFRAENKNKIGNILKDVKKRIKTTPTKLLDMGCGTGFILHLAVDEFDELHGVDITKAMMDQIDLSSGKITLHTSPAENTPFDDASFNCVTAYSMMDHLLDLKLFLQEVYRVLEKDGVFYSDQNANKYFWDGLAQVRNDKNAQYSPIVDREIKASLDLPTEAAECGVSQEDFNLTEYIKFNENGIDAEQFIAMAKEIGFSSCEVEYEWFLGQGPVMHGQSYETADNINAWLNTVLPLSRHLFKYLRFILVK